MGYFVYLLGEQGEKQVLAWIGKRKDRRGGCTWGRKERNIMGEEHCQKILWGKKRRRAQLRGFFGEECVLLRGVRALNVGL